MCLLSDYSHRQDNPKQKAQVRLTAGINPADEQPTHHEQSQTTRASQPGSSGIFREEVGHLYLCRWLSSVLLEACFWIWLCCGFSAHMCVSACGHSRGSSFWLHLPALQVSTWCVCVTTAQRAKFDCDGCSRRSAWVMFYCWIILAFVFICLSNLVVPLQPVWSSYCSCCRSYRPFSDVTALPDLNH